MEIEGVWKHILNVNPLPLSLKRTPGGWQTSPTLFTPITVCHKIHDVAV